MKRKLIGHVAHECSKVVFITTELRVKELNVIMKILPMKSGIFDKQRQDRQEQ